MSDLGIFKDVVGTAGTLMAAGMAITLAFKGRTRWEPAEDDVPSGPARVAALIVSVMIALMWYQAAEMKNAGSLTTISIGALVGCLVGLLSYVFLVTTYVYQIEIAISSKKTAFKNIVGGFWLTNSAEKKLSKKNVTIQTLLKGAGNQPDLIWPRHARGIAKILFIVAFLMLQVLGSIALAAAALLISTRS